MMLNKIYRYKYIDIDIYLNIYALINKYYKHLFENNFNSFKK